MSLHKRAGLFYTRVSPTNIERGVSRTRVKLQSFIWIITTKLIQIIVDNYIYNISTEPKANYILLIILCVFLYLQESMINYSRQSNTITNCQKCNLDTKDNTEFYLGIFKMYFN